MMDVNEVDTILNAFKESDDFKYFFLGYVLGDVIQYKGVSRERVLEKATEYLAEARK